MAKNTQKRAKRANKPNPREDRNVPHLHLVASNDQPATRRKRVQLIPRNLAQEDYVEALRDPNQYLVFAMGPAGCGKTLLATQFAISQLQVGDVQKIIITRPAVSVDESYGYLPGTITEKLSPWMIPILDVFKEHYPTKEVERMLAEEIIEIAPLGFMRGRTLKNSIVIFDEAQNATPNQMKMVLTRLGENSRMIITGDLRQHDRGYENNGLKDFIERLQMRGSQHISVCRFSNADVERHPIIEEVLSIYGE